MQLILDNLRIPLEEDGMAAYLQAAAERLGVAAGECALLKILAKALDARDQEQFYYKLTLAVAVGDDYGNGQKFAPYQEAPPPAPPRARGKERPIVVGFGPAGMFAALALIDAGYKPIVLERGKRIEERAGDVNRFLQERTLDEESNVQFGEGGAGSFSDGKLFSRRNNNTSAVNRVLTTFIKFGAPAEIAYIAKPHLGTDVLCVIVRNIRDYILARGGEIHYGAKMTELLVAAGQAVGVVANGTQEFLAPAIFLALGHSARETMAMLHAKGVALERKAIAVGVRIEHPVATINRLRYGQKYMHHPALGAATYSLNHTNRQIKRGVYTFCMCPGGEVINASSAQGLLVVNGMSYSRRASPFSNAALVVSCHGEDYGAAGPLAGLAFQGEIERKAFLAGGGGWKVPAQNLLDFLGEEKSTDLRPNSFAMGAEAADLKDIFPSFVVAELHAAFRQWRATVPLFVSGEAILLGAETRTSSPVRILRDARFQSVSVPNLYPLGEGAGYTGGITSSAADALKAVAAFLGGD